MMKIASGQGKSQGRSPRNFPRAQAIFHCISQLESQYRHSQLQLQHYLSVVINIGKFILQTAPKPGQYRKILPSRLGKTGE